jgi:4-hydroxybenzoate polyprenyltransferase
VIPTAPAPDAVLADPHGSARSVRRLLSCIRFDEVLVLQGAPLLGALFAMNGLTVERLLMLMVLAAGSCCLVAHVFLLNDWSGVGADLEDPNRAAEVFMARGIGRTEIAYLCLGLLAVSLLLLSRFGSQTVVIASMIAALSALYSAPPSQLKGVPLMSSALHLAGGMLHFLLGYSVFHAVDVRSLVIGGFFALVFSGGHLTHEVRDLEGDRRSGIGTNAARFGKARSFVAGLVLFMMADLLLVVLAIRGAVPPLLVIVAALYPLHLYWSLRAFRAGLTFESVRRLQLRYRLLYAIVGVLMAATVLLRR